MASGFLPPFWVLFWSAVSFIILGWSISKVRRMLRERPEQKMMIAVSGAFMFVLSSLKIPSITGSSSHPTGTGMSAVLYGVAVSSVLSLIVLVFQSMLIAHGGIDTLGANVFSMGIAGPFIAYLTFKGVQKAGAPFGASVFLAAFLADLSTYLVTALQLAIAYPSGGDFLYSFEVFAGVFAITQIPLAIIEGLIVMMFFDALSKVRPEILTEIGASTRKIGRGVKYAASAVMITAVIVLALVMNNGLQFSGSDDEAIQKVIQISPGYSPWFNLGYDVPGEFQAPLLAIQAIIGIALIVFVAYRVRSKAMERG